MNNIKVIMITKIANFLYIYDKEAEAKNKVKNKDQVQLFNIEAPA
jgi:hypothetical protein